MPKAQRPARHRSLSQVPSEFLGGLPPAPGTVPASLWRMPRTGYPWLVPPRTPEGQGQGQRHTWRSTARVLYGKQVALLHHVAGKMFSLYRPNISHQNVVGIFYPAWLQPFISLQSSFSWQDFKVQCQSRRCIRTASDIRVACREKVKQTRAETGRCMQ